MLNLETGQRFKMTDTGKVVTVTDVIVKLMTRTKDVTRRVWVYVQFDNDPGGTMTACHLQKLLVNGVFEHVTN